MKRLFVFLLTVLAAIYLVGCAGSKPKPSESKPMHNKGKAQNVQKKSKKQSNAAEEDEVLKLLGITPEEKKAETKKAPSAANISTQEKELKAKIAQLQQELNRKDSEVGELQNELKQKEEKLKEMEEMLATIQASGVSSTQKTTQGASSRHSAPTGSFQARYEEALNLYKNRHYREAIQRFQTLIQEDPNNSLSDNCQYWIGECYYSLGKYNQALVEFQKVFTFPHSNKEDDAQLKIGMTYLRLGDKARAKKAFKTLIENYPRSEYVPIAKRYLNQL